MMQQRIAEHPYIPVNDDVLVHFHVAHRVILVLQPALESALPATKERSLVATGIAPQERSSQKDDLERNVIAVDVGVLHRWHRLFRELRREDSVGIATKKLL